MNYEKTPGEIAIFANQRAKERDYWLNRLAGEWVKPYFPYDNKRESGQTDPDMKTQKTTRQVEFSFAGELFTALVKLSRGIDQAVHAIAAAAINILLNKYTGSQDIIIGTPVSRQTFAGAFINTVLVLRNQIQPKMKFKELLLQVKQTIDRAIENQNYPVEILPEQLNRTADPGEDFPLFDVSILLENIHDNKYLQHIDHNFTFSFRKTGNALEGNVRYNSSLYEKETIRRVITHLTNIFNQVMANLDLEIREIEMTAGDEKKQLVYEFNNTGASYPQNKTIHQWFADQVEQAPGKIAVCSPIDSGDIFIPTSCFKKNPYIYETDLRFDYHPGKTGGTINLKLLKTPDHNSVVVNRNMWKLINLFDGERNIESIFSRLQSENLKDIKLVIYTKETGDLLEITHDFNRQAEIFSNMDPVAFISLVRLLYTNYIIEPTAVKSYQTGLEKTNRQDFTDMDTAELIDDRIVLGHLLNPLENKAAKLSTADVLLLGDTPGMPGSGLLYLASYLKRNGVKAYCRFYDSARDLQAMKREIEELLQTLQPKVVAISLKWFLYIARVLDMCRIVREYSQRNALPITIVVGGNTGSFYWENIIDDENIDYIIRGDGELPLLKICQGEKPDNIPNCVYKTNGKTHANPITFIKNETNSSDIYLSHLEEILLWNKASLFGTFFIYTHLGCGMNCFYCGGCRQAQQKTFNRKTAFIRPPAEVKKDIMEALPLVSTFHFDFDIIHKDLVGYCSKIWEGIDLSGHFCLLNSLKPPPADLIELAARTFKYVYWDLDVLTLSQRHRKQLFSMGLVKPQLTDEEILSVLDRCDGCDNVEVRLNLINGLPYLLPEDIEAAEKFLDIIMSRHRSFSELHWGRLHAQPGAPVLDDPGKYDMHAFAVSYQEFQEYSKKNFNSQSLHQRLEHLNYPYIYFNDEALNSKLSLHFSETDKKIQKYKESIRTNRMPVETFTYRQLDEKADQLARVLRTRGCTTDVIAAVMLTPTIDIPMTILAVLKTGAAYLPIDPESPGGRIRYMLNDSKVKLLVIKTSEISERSKVNRLSEMIELVDLDTTAGNSTAPPTQMIPPPHPAQLCYAIYTSGTTGKPKAVLLTHQNLVNYVTWFTRETRLTHHDKTMLISSFAFDLGYTSLYPSLLVGGECHILARDIYLSPNRLLNYIEQKGITYIKSTPSLFKPLVNSPGFSLKKCKTLRLAVIGGEPIDLDDIETAHSICPHLEIVNHYGPTEATIGCIARYIDFNRFEEYKMTPTIGRPIANTRVYILNQDFNLQPAGLPGELCISGTGLARGYLNRPELTAEKFLTVFYKSYRSYMSYLYRSGDLARWLPDGTIEFLGRIDKQVKIRGYRIELEEIKNQLTRHQQIKDAVLIDRQDKKGDKYLCAYFVPEKTEMQVNEDEKPLSLEEIGEKENMNTLPGDNHGSIPALFQQQVEKYHDHIALESNGKPWTYETLNNYANQVARIILENYDDRSQLSEKELVRYKRQMLLHGWGQAFQ
ncbi:amino acid adenylation domain-containing protein [Acidobacteriota bacterium]